MSFSIVGCEAHSVPCCTDLANFWMQKRRWQPSTTASKAFFVRSTFSHGAQVYCRCWQHWTFRTPGRPQSSLQHPTGTCLLVENPAGHHLSFFKSAKRALHFFDKKDVMQSLLASTGLGVEMESGNHLLCPIVFGWDIATYSALLSTPTFKEVCETIDNFGLELYERLMARIDCGSHE